jgi:integrating conjugative element protein (TIGR03758 family)
MAIDAASSAAFVQGSGVDSTTLQMTVVSVAAMGVLLWLAWTAFALWRDWREGSLGLMDQQWGLVRAAALGLLLIFLIR